MDNEYILFVRQIWNILLKYILEDRSDFDELLKY